MSLEREKGNDAIPEKETKQNVVKEGSLHCKITEIDGKVSCNLGCPIAQGLTTNFLIQRAADRSWKQIWAVLQGPKLFLYKDRHHQVSSTMHHYRRFLLGQRLRAFF